MTSSISYSSNDIRTINGTIDECQDICKKDRSCTHFTHVDRLSNSKIIILRECFIKSGKLTVPKDEKSNFNSGLFYYRIYLDDCKLNNNGNIF